MKHFVTVYCASVKPLENEALYRTTYSLADKERRCRADRFVRDADKRLCIGAGLLLRYAVETETGAQMPEMKISENGKPYFETKAPEFSISHSGEYVLCALSDAAVGCDIEKTDGCDVRLATRFFAPSEREYVFSGSSDEEKQLAFCRLWTLKESFLKATGLGLRLPLDSFEISPDEPITVRQKINEKDYSFVTFENIDGYKCSVCVEGKSENVRFEMIDVEDMITEKSGTHK